MGKAAKSGSGNKVTNPMLAVDLELELSEEQVPEQDMSAAAMIEANASEMTEDELADLTYAFQAADMNGAGAVDSGEFMTMLQVMGCQISMEQVKGIIGESKDGFRAWKLVADEENVARCKAIWDQFDDDKSGTMDLKEINAVINKLNERGSALDLLTPTIMQNRFNGEMDFDEFSAWYLKQVRANFPCGIGMFKIVVSIRRDCLPILQHLKQGPHRVPGL
jgi:Ca2+-binding EF-hand superfamily protein